MWHTQAAGASRCAPAAWLTPLIYPAVVMAAVVVGFAGAVEVPAGEVVVTGSVVLPFSPPFAGWPATRAATMTG